MLPWQHGSASAQVIGILAETKESSEGMWLHQTLPVSRVNKGARESFCTVASADCCCGLVVVVW